MSKTPREVIAGYQFTRVGSGGDNDYNDEHQLLDDDADAIIAALNAAGFVIVQWQPIETVPKDGLSVLVATSKWMAVSHWDSSYGWWGLPNEQPTHWMSVVLPQPGKTEG